MTKLGFNISNHMFSVSGSDLLPRRNNDIFHANDPMFKASISQSANLASSTGHLDEASVNLHRLDGMVRIGFQFNGNKDGCKSHALYVRLALTSISPEDEIFDEDDEKLKELKSKELGDQVYDAVAKVLKEINEYNPSGRYIVKELRNFKENKEAKLEEAVFIYIEEVEIKQKEEMKLHEIPLYLKKERKTLS